MLCIDSGVLGTFEHLLVDDGYAWVSSVPDGAWHLTDDVKPYHPRCLNSLFRLEGVELDTRPPAAFVRAMEIVSSSSLAPWSYIMPSRSHRAFMGRLVEQSMDYLNGINQAYYKGAWSAGNVVLRSLVPARVDPKRFDEIVDDAGMNKRVIEGFRPDSDNLAREILYDRFGTRTGRLTVKSGPGILTMKKEYRDVVVPSFPGGHIVSLDFSALEVRVLLYEAGGKSESTDLYAHIAKELFDDAYDRKAVKAAVIAESYGSGKATLGKFLNISGDALDNFVDKIREYMGVKTLRDRVASQFWKSGYIANHYGRKVQIAEPMGHIFVNSYAQSTGVDVSLMGFSDVVTVLSKTRGVRPLFVVHDELILDVAPERLDEVMSLSHVNVPGYVQKFPLRAKILR